MKLKKWVKVALLIIVEILTITLLMNCNTSIDNMTKIFLISTIITCENLIMFIEG